ncbi:hypothetical protein C823_003362 [Eubacterium plexicaudatum ASF492]|nr:hypothetical protein C823_003362 [Eubacterium plexicaudatum ASF492]
MQAVANPDGKTGSLRQDSQAAGYGKIKVSYAN